MTGHLHVTKDRTHPANPEPWRVELPDRTIADTYSTQREASALADRLTHPDRDVRTEAVAR